MYVPSSWLSEFVSVKLSPQKLAECLTMGGIGVDEIKQEQEDFTMLLDVTPNRADGLSILGIAREVAALTASKFRPPAIRIPPGKGKIADLLRVEVLNPEQAPRYAARLVRGVKIKPSLPWLTKRLEACGVRPINNIVDATNYLMLERGQPLHAFDLSLIQGKCITVRVAGVSVKFDTLDGVERTFHEDDLLICDGEGPVALAGIMGGGNSEVRSTTTDVLLESACFEPLGIRRTSKRLSLVTESSRRFERGVDPNGTLVTLHELTRLIVEIAGGEPTADWIDIYPKPLAPRHVSLDLSEIERILGRTFSVAEVIAILERLGIERREKGKVKLTFLAPTFRPDLSRPIDLIEELARVSGYHHIEACLPVKCMQLTTQPPLVMLHQKIRSTLIAFGLSEAVVLSFTSGKKHEAFVPDSAKWVNIANPLSQEQGVMCSTPLIGLLEAAQLNHHRQRQNIRLFTLQRAYRSTLEGNVQEQCMVTGLIMGQRFPYAWDRAKERCDFYDIKGVVEPLLESGGMHDDLSWVKPKDVPWLHPGNAAQLRCGERELGFGGQLHPKVAALWDLEDVFVFELNVDLLGSLAASDEKKLVDVSRFPFVERDVSLLVDETISAERLLHVIHQSDVALLHEVKLFDCYQGKGIPSGKKSMAYTLRYGSPERTLTDDEVTQAHEKVIANLQKDLGATLRL